MGLILVVYVHVILGLVRAGIFPDGPITQWIDFGLNTFRMPLAFFLAELNVSMSLSRGGPRPFLRAKAWTIAYPYVLWSLIQGILVINLARDVNVPITVSDLVAIPYRPLSQFWFLYALMICHILAVLIPNRRVLAALSALGFVIFQFLPIRPDLALTLHHLPLYVAGLYASQAMWGVPPGGWAIAGLLWIGFGLAVLGGGIISMDSNGVAAIPACLLGVAGVVWVSRTVRHAPWLAMVGKMSMTIYVLHIMAGAWLRTVMLRLHVPPIPMDYLLAGTILGVVVPMMVHTALSRAGILPWFGLALWRRKTVRA